MRETQAIIDRVSRLNDHYQRLHLSVENLAGEIKPGHSLLARRDTREWEPYLRQRWWPSTINPAGSAFSVDLSTDISYQPGEVIHLLGLVGEPFRHRRTLRHVLLLAVDTPPLPLLLSIPFLLSNSISVTLVISGTGLDYPARLLPPEVEVIQADDELNWANQVMTVGLADQVFVVVNPDRETERMEAVWKVFQQRRAEVPKLYLFGVMQSPIPCGVGACQACLLALKEGLVTMCTEGPSIDLTLMGWG